MKRTISGGNGMLLEIIKHKQVKCDMCKSNNTPVLYAYSLDDHYGSVAICLACAKEWFKIATDEGID